LSGFDASNGEPVDFEKKLFYCGGDGREHVAEQREGAFLDTLVEFVETDFQPSGAPHLRIQRRMVAMNECRHDELSEEFAFQAIFLGRMGGVNAKNTLELFENQLDLPSEPIKRTNDFNR
jgi:hypothetical protein